MFSSWRRRRGPDPGSPPDDDDGLAVSPASAPSDAEGARRLRRLVEAVNAAIAPTELRLQAIAEAIYEFDHRSARQHDREIYEGAANVLFQKLAFATRVRHPERDREVAMICTALEMVYRASDAAIERSFEEIGRDVLPLFATVVDRAFETDGDDGDGGGALAITKDKKIAVQKITKVLSAFSLVPSAKIPLAHEKGASNDGAGLLASLVKVIDVTGFNRSRALDPSGGDPSSAVVGTGHLMTEAARFNAVATLTNLAFAEGNRAVMMAEPGLVLNAAVVANTAKNEMARQCAALTIMNLSEGGGGGEGSPFAEEVLGEDRLLDVFVGLLKDERPEVRRDAAVSLYNLASTEDDVALIMRYGEEMVLDVAVEVLNADSATLWNPNSKINAAQTMFQISCKSRETAQLMTGHFAILPILSLLILKHDTEPKVQMFIAAILRRLSEVIEHPDPDQGRLLSALVRASAWTETGNGDDAVVRCFEVQAASLDANRPVMARHPGLLDALGALALDASEGREDVRSAALSALELLSRDEGCRPVLAAEGAVVAALGAAAADVPENLALDEELFLRCRSALERLIAPRPEEGRDGDVDVDETDDPDVDETDVPDDDAEKMPGNEEGRLGTEERPARDDDLSRDTQFVKDGADENLSFR